MGLVQNRLVHAAAALGSGLAAQLSPAIAAGNAGDSPAVANSSPVEQIEEVTVTALRGVRLRYDF
jgi:hypothetical protein